MKSAIWLFGQIARAIFFTVLLSALIHLTLEFYEFIRTGNVSYINPVTFLGINTVAPKYADSSMAVGIGWAALTIVGSTIFLFRSRHIIKTKYTKIRRWYRTSLVITLYRSALRAGTKSGIR